MVLERLVCLQIEEYFESNGFLGEFQFGFRRHKNTVTELITLFDHILESKEEGKEIFLLLWDLSAAFDTVCHKVLCSKLKLYGFDDLAMKWVKSFLEDRKQAVTVSGKVDIKIGTPQGSRLSPLLFVILMSDLDLHAEKSFKTNFADDTQNTVTADSKEEGEAITKEEAEEIGRFFSSNNLVNNADKAALLYNSKGSAGKTVMTILQEEIEAQETEKLLGLMVSSRFDWKAHVDNLCIKLKQRLGLLHRLKQKLPRDKLVIVAEAIFNTSIRYGIAVYLKPRLKDQNTGSYTQCALAQTLQVLQNDMIRLICGLKRSDHVNMKKKRQQLKMLSVNQMCTYHVLLETNNIIKNNASEQIKRKLTKYETKHTLRSNNRGDLAVPKKPKKTCMRFSYYSPKLWNLVPLNIRNLEKPSAFKDELKRWVVENIED